MKKMYILLLVIFICINLSCLSSKKVKVRSCEREFLQYHNYDYGKDLNKLKDIDNVRELSDTSLAWYMSEGANFVEIDSDKIIFIPKKEFFNDPESNGDIPLYVIGYSQNNDLKQYLVSELHLGQNSSLYLINEIDEKIVSMFLVNSKYNSGFHSEDLQTKKISDSIFQIRIFTTSDVADDPSSGLCISQIKVSEKGVLIPSSVTFASE